MKITVRDYSSSDYIELISLLNKVYGSEIDQKTLEEKYLTSERRIYVAVTEDNDLVGCIFTELQEDYIRPSRMIYVTYVAVNEDYRQCGIGRKMFEYVEDMCCKKRCSAIEFTSADFRIGAHVFYDKLGYTKKKTTHFIKEI